MIRAYAGVFTVLFGLWLLLVSIGLTGLLEPKVEGWAHVAAWIRLSVVHDGLRGVTMLALSVLGLGVWLFRSGIRGPRPRRSAGAGRSRL